MKLSEVNINTIKKVSDKELLNLHYRLHQLYQNAKKNNNIDKIKEYKRIHNIVIKEMDRRKLKHKSPLRLLEFLFENY